MIDWNIQSRSHHCQACEKPFVDKQSYHTVLCDGKSDYQRVDVCDACWKAKYSAAATGQPGYISLWQGVYEAPPPAPPEAIQKENAETMLRKLMELNDPQYRTACYILAVMLERKRLLKIKTQSTEGGQRVFIYEHPKSGDVFTILDPKLQLDQLEAVQRQVADLLEFGLNPPPSTTATESSPAAPVEESTAPIEASGDSAEPAVPTTSN